MQDLTTNARGWHVRRTAPKPTTEAAERFATLCRECDLPMCEDCHHQVGEDWHFCSVHFSMWEHERKAKEVRLPGLRLVR